MLIKQEDNKEGTRYELRSSPPWHQGLWRFSGKQTSGPDFLCLIQTTHEFSHKIVHSGDSLFKENKSFYEERNRVNQDNNAYQKFQKFELLIIFQ